MSAVQFDDALHVMEVQGGSFVKALAHCCYVADTANRAKLRAAFADYFEQYEARFRAHVADATAPTAQQLIDSHRTGDHALSAAVEATRVAS